MVKIVKRAFITFTILCLLASEALSEVTSSTNPAPGTPAAKKPSSPVSHKLKKFNCRKNPQEDKCPNNSWCNPTGLCICNEFYFGVTCEINISNSKTLEIMREGIPISTYWGMVAGFIVGFLAFLFIGLLIIYCVYKDKNY